MHIITAQESLEDVVDDIAAGRVAAETVWVARRVGDGPQQLFQLAARLGAGVEFADPAARCTLRRVGGRYTLTVLADAATYTLQAPAAATRVGGAQSRLSAIDLTPDGAVLVAGTAGGDVLQYDTASHALLRRVGGAHGAAVSKAVVFPSGAVVLTVGDDLQAKLWSLGSSSPTATRVFRDQRQRLTDAAIVGRGRNFVTASADGSVNLWECSTAQVVSRFRRIGGLDDPATCVAVGRGAPLAAEHVANGHLLFDCADALMYVGYASGVIQQYSVAGHFQTQQQVRRACGVSTVAVAGAFLVAGYADGVLAVHELAGGVFGAGWHLQLNAAHAVEHVAAEPAGRGLRITVANGPETLLRVAFDNGRFDYVYLVGLPEMFRVQSIRGSVVATADHIARY